MPEQSPEQEDRTPAAPAAEQDGRDDGQDPDLHEIAGDVDLRRLEEPASRIGGGDRRGE
jgi:hypothetical protein